MALEQPSWAVSEKDERRVEVEQVPRWSEELSAISARIHRHTLASPVRRKCRERKCGRKRKKNIHVSAYKRRKGLSVAAIIWWLSDFSARPGTRGEIPLFLLLAARLECSLAPEKVRRTSYLSPGAKGLSACRHITLRARPPPPPFLLLSLRVAPVP